MESKEKLSKIIEALESGKTLFFSTCLKHIKVTPKTYKKWQKSGYELFKADSKSVYIAEGKKFSCIDGCKITVEG